jgi:regulator of Ty1 transposition protein 103
VEEAQVDGYSLPGIGQPTNVVPSDTDLPGLTNLSSLLQQGSPNGVNSKKRKVAHEEEDYAQFASGDLDADVAELLNQEGYPQER